MIIQVYHFFSSNEKESVFVIAPSNVEGVDATTQVDL